MPMKNIKKTWSLTASNSVKHRAKSKYTMESTDDFLERVKNVRIINHDMVSFDVVSLFINVPIEFTIDVILDKVYNKCLINQSCPERN